MKTLEELRKEDIELLKRIICYKPFHGGAIATTLAYIPPAQAMRNAADRMEQEERDFNALSEFIKRMEDNILKHE